MGRHSRLELASNEQPREHPRPTICGHTAAATAAAEASHCQPSYAPAQVGIHQLHAGEAVAPAPRERVEHAPQAAVQGEELHLAGQVEEQVGALCRRVCGTNAESDVCLREIEAGRQGTAAAAGAAATTPTPPTLTVDEWLQPLKEPVQVGLQVVDAVDQAPVGPQPQPLLRSATAASAASASLPEAVPGSQPTCPVHPAAAAATTPPS